MNIENNRTVLENSFDLLAIYEIAITPNEQTDLLSKLVTTLSDFEKPKEQTTTKLTGAYHFVSIALNALKLGLLGFSSFDKSMSVTYNCVEASYSILFD